MTPSFLCIRKTYELHLFKWPILGFYGAHQLLTPGESAEKLVLKPQMRANIPRLAIFLAIMSTLERGVPILVKFGSGVGFGPKTTPSTFFLPIGPVNLLVRASEGSNFGIFEKCLFGPRLAPGRSREYPKAPLAPFCTQERSQKNS